VADRRGLVTQARADWRAYRGWALLGVMLAVGLCALGLARVGARYTWDDLLAGLAAGTVTEVKLHSAQDEEDLFSPYWAVVEDGGTPRRLPVGSESEHLLLTGLLGRFGVAVGGLDEDALALLAAVHSERTGKAVSAFTVVTSSLSMLFAWLSFLAVRAALRRRNIPGFVSLAWGLALLLAVLAAQVLSEAGFVVVAVVLLVFTAYPALILLTVASFRVRRMAWRIKRLSAAAVLLFAAGSVAWSAGAQEVAPADFLHALYTGGVATWRVTRQNAPSWAEPSPLRVEGEYVGGGGFSAVFDSSAARVLGAAAAAQPPSAVAIPDGALRVMLLVGLAGFAWTAALLYAWGRSCGLLGFKLLALYSIASVVNGAIALPALDSGAEMLIRGPGVVAWLAVASIIGSLVTLIGLAGLYVLGFELADRYAFREGGVPVPKGSLEEGVGQEA